MPAKAEDEGGLTPVEDDNVGRREIYRKYPTISRTSDYKPSTKKIHKATIVKTLKRSFKSSKSGLKERLRVLLDFYHHYLTVKRDEPST